MCNDLSVNNIDEVGACIYGVLFKLYQFVTIENFNYLVVCLYRFDANLTIHQRTHVQQAQIQEESIAAVIDMM